MNEVHSTRFMHPLRCTLWAVAFLLLLPRITAGNYPAGNGTLSQSFDFPDATTNLLDGSLIGSDQAADLTLPVAGVFANALRLSSKDVTNAIGSFKLPDLDPGSVIRTMDLKLNLRMETAAGADPSEGWSINFGRIPADNGTGEGGFAPLPRGLTLSFKTHPTAGETSSIQISVSGVIIGEFPRVFTFNNGQRILAIHWDSAGLDVSIDKAPVCTDLPTPGFTPAVEPKKERVIHSGRRDRR